MPKVVVCRELGPPERLWLEEVPSVPLKPGEVRVAIRAAGINFPDVLMAADGPYRSLIDSELRRLSPTPPGSRSAGEAIRERAA